MPRWKSFRTRKSPDIKKVFQEILSKIFSIHCVPTICIFFIFSYSHNLLSVPETWRKQIFFTEKKKLPGGFVITELSFPSRFGDPIFRLHQLTYSSRRNFEELRMEGQLSIGKDETIHLIPNKCTVMALGKSYRRWIPIRAFDCDHIRMEFFHAKPIPELKDYEGDILQFPSAFEPKEGEIVGLIVKEVEGEGVIGFTSQSRYVIKKNKVRLENHLQFWNEEVIDGNDSLLKISNPNIPPGTKFYIPKKKASESLK